MAVEEKQEGMQPDEMHCQAPDPETIQCKDCMYRDKSTMKLGLNVIPVGCIKSFCEKYEKPPKSNGKPDGVLFGTLDCQFYRMEES